MALIRSFTHRTAQQRLNRKETECEYVITDDETHGRLLVLRTYSENRKPTTSPAQVYDLDVSAARQLRALLKDQFKI